MSNQARPQSRLTVIQHHPAEHCGDVADWAAARGIILDVYRADLNQLPQGAQAQPMLLLGGPYPLDAHPNKLLWLHHEQTWLAQHVARGVPMFGICLGAQLLCVARGGTVNLMARAETGWAKITLANGAVLEALQWHDDACSLPEDARILGFNEHCLAQYFAFNGAADGTATQIGVQFHPEWNPALVDAINAYFNDESPLPKFSNQAPANTEDARFKAISAWFWALLDSWWAAANSAPPSPFKKVLGHVV